MRSICCRRVFSTSSRRFKAGIYSPLGKRVLTIVAHALKSLRQEEIEERIRDPAPPANFPTVCPVNPPLRHIIGRLNREVWQKHNLHKIPYRDTESTEPALVFDGERWPETEEEKLKYEIPTGDEADPEVIDIFTQKEAQRKEELETGKLDFHDVSYNMLHKLLESIKNPIEMQLLPHIIREWHRRGFPVTMHDAHKIAELSYKLQQPDVVIQMTQLEVYGICYDLEGIREVVRALARKASSRRLINAQSQDKPFTTDDMLRSAPKVLQCAVGVDAKRALEDPVVLGTQFWALTRRFMEEPEYRTTKRALELCKYAEWLVALLERGSILIENSNSSSNPRIVAYGIHQHIGLALYDYMPVRFALQQFLDIAISPWFRCDQIYRPIELTEKDQKSRLRQFLDQAETLKELDGPSRRNLFRVLNHQFIPQAVRDHKIAVSDLKPWQWAILKQYAPAPNERDKFLTSDRSEYFEPDTERYHLITRAQQANRLLGKAIGRLRHQMKIRTVLERRHTHFKRTHFID